MKRQGGISGRICPRNFCHAPKKPVHPRLHRSAGAGQAGLRYSGRPGRRQSGGKWTHPRQGRPSGIVRPQDAGPECRRWYRSLFRGWTTFGGRRGRCTRFSPAFSELLYNKYRKRLTINGKECKMVTSPEDAGISTFFTIPHSGVQSTQPVTGKFGGTLCAASHRAPRRRFAFKRRGVGRYGRTSNTRGRGNRCSASGRRGFAA